MSEMVRQQGTITPFEFSTDNLTIYEMIQELKSADVDIDENDSIEYDSITGDGVVVVKGVVYTLSNTSTSSPDDGYCRIIPNRDGSLYFDTVYYNGSTFLEEQLEQAFDDNDAITFIRDVHDTSKVRVWNVTLDDKSFIDECVETYDDTSELNVQDIVFEYLKLNTQLPIDIIKELGKDEVYRIIKQLDWHI